MAISPGGIGRRALQTLIVVGLCLFITSADLPAQHNASAVQVTARLLTTSEDGPTTTSGTSSSGLQVGETGRFFVAAGQLQGNQGGCGPMFSGGHPTDETITARIQKEFEEAVDGDGYFWDVQVAIEEISNDKAVVEVRWGHLGGFGGRRESVEQSATLRLPFGTRRLLAQVPFEASNLHPSCRVTSYHLELEITPEPHPSMAGLDLVYELWFARTRDGRREEFAATEILAGQAEEVSFRVPALRQPIPGVRSTAGDPVTLAAQSRGTIRAWSTGPETLSVQINPSLHHRLGSPIESGFGSGQGSKLYAARPGETIELELPEVHTRLTVPAEGITLSEPAVEGVAILGPGLKLDFHQVLGGARYSLLVRIRIAD